MGVVEAAGSLRRRRRPRSHLLAPLPGSALLTSAPVIVPLLFTARLFLDNLQHGQINAQLLFLSCWHSCYFASSGRFPARSPAGREHQGRARVAARLPHLQAMLARGGMDARVPRAAESGDPDRDLRPRRRGDTVEELARWWAVSYRSRSPTTQTGAAVGPEAVPDGRGRRTNPVPRRRGVVHRRVARLFGLAARRRARQKATDHAIFVVIAVARRSTPSVLRR